MTILHVNHKLIEQQGVTLPWQVRAAPKLRFQPLPFTAGGTSYLRAKLIDADVQTKSYEAFRTSPSAPCLYGIGSEPDDITAKVFAAHLLSLHLAAFPMSNVGWLHAHDRNDVLREPPPYSFVVISSVTPMSTPYRVERVRDLLEHYCDVPRLLVIGGADPVTFCASVLHVRLTHVFFKPSQLVNHAVEVV